MARRLALALIAAACALPAAAQAEVSDFGSDLSLPATASHNSGPDISYWNAGPTPGLGSYVAPAEGQVTTVKLKGALIPNPRLRGSDEERIAQIIHFQVLRDKGDGRLKIVQLSTGHMQMPISDQPEQVVTEYKPVNLCVKRGDVVAFNTIGAHEYRRDPGTLGGPQGAEYQVFGIAPDMITQFYSKDNGLNEQTTIDPSPNDVLFRHELLMRTTLATGPDSTDICPGGYAQHVFRGADINPPPKVSPIVVRTKDRNARVRIFCHGENYGGCVGSLKLMVGDLELGAARFDVPNTHTEAVEVPLSATTIAAIQAAGTMKVTAVADATDKPASDPRNTDAPGTRPAPQRKTTSEELTLKPDKAPCIVPKKLVGKSSKSAKAAISKAGCKTVVKYKKVKSAKQSGKVLAQKPKAGTVLPAGSAVTITVGRRG
ncbi:MAG TPA: PASTA domain-containing protein [Thermoleophilaceae bacterium]|jgi:hypothetical protein